jgi:hypothetical protein
VKTESFKINKKTVNLTLTISSIVALFAILGFFLTYTIHAYSLSQIERLTDESSGENSLKIIQNYEFSPLPQIADEIEELKATRALEIQVEEQQRKIESVEAIFRKYNSPMQGYAELIINRTTECGGDYKIIVAIAGNESGFGRIPYKKYNPYGYLDGVQYSGWEEALDYLSCKISEQHLAPCNNDLYCIIQRYGGPETDQAKWLRNIRWFMEQI